MFSLVNKVYIIFNAISNMKFVTDARFLFLDENLHVVTRNKS